MRYEKLIVFMLIVSFFVFVSVARTAGKPGNSQMPVTYHLLVEKKVSAQAETIACRLRAENNTKELQFLSRPKEEDISLAIKGLDKRLYSVSFEERGFENLAKLGIYLRPKCAIEMKLATIVPKKYEEGKSWIPRGKYSITASWKRPGLPGVEAGKFEVVKKYTPVITDFQQRKNEYPLGIILEPSSKTYYWGEPIMLSVRIENNGALPVRLKNYFHRYKDFFRFEKKYAASNMKVQELPYIVALITPHAIEGWITLLPGEVLSVAIDASDEFKIPSEYRAAVTYLDRILLYPKDGKPKYPNYPSRGLIFPPDGKPYYTKQHLWPSNEISLIISVAPREEQVKEEIKIVMAKNKDAVVRAECIKANTGSTVGFRIEVINPNADKDIVLVVRDNISYLFYVRLIDQKGLDISPVAPLMEADKRGPNIPKTYRYDIILPGTSHSWFVPVPNQVRADPRKPTNDNNLQATPKGEYMVEIKVVVGYFTQDKGVESIPKYPDFQVLRLTLPRISISVDPNLFNLDIIKTYTGSVNK